MATLCPLIALAALSSGAPLPSIESPVTASLPPQPLSRLVPELAKQTGVDLQVSKSVENDVAMVQVKGVPLRDLMQKIATVSGRRWESHGDHFTLTSSTEADRAAERQVMARRAEIIRKAIQQLVADPAFHRKWTQQEAIDLANRTETLMNPKDGRLDGSKINFADFRGFAPTDRALAQVVAIMDPTELARAWSRRQVFATSPTSMQRPLPNGALPIFNQLLREQAMFVDATNDFRDRLGPQTSSFSMGNIARGEFRKGNSKLGIGKVILRAEGSEVDSYLSLSMTLTDRAGVVLLNGDLSVPIDPAKPFPIAAKGLEPKVVGDALVKEMASTDSQSASNGNRMSMAAMRDGELLRLDVPQSPPHRKIPLSGELKSLILKPDQIDPLSLTAGKILAAGAHDRGENLVACLDDGIFHDSLSALARGIGPSEYLSTKDFQDYEDVTASDGWLTIQPKDFAGARKRRVNRQALAKLMASVDRNKLLLLDDLCAFSLSQETAMGEQLMDLTYLRLLNPGAANGTYDASKWFSYRFFGALTREQKQALGSGASVPAQNLSPLARQALSQYVFDSYVEGHFTKPDGKPIEPWGEGIVTEWTEVLPNGVTDGASITASVKQEEAAYCVDSPNNSAQIVSADAFAVLQFVSEAPGLREGAQHFDRFSPATQWTYSFKFGLAPGVSVDPALTDGAIVAATTSSDVKSLSDGFQNRYAAMLKKYRDNFGNMDFTGRSQGIPPSR